MRPSQVSMKEHKSHDNSIVDRKAESISRRITALPPWPWIHHDFHEPGMSRDAVSIGQLYRRRVHDNEQASFFLPVI